MEFTVVQGDIAAQQADALVNAANTGLRMGSGVAGALRRAAGERLNEAAVEKGPIDLGGAVETPAFDLDAEYVIHAAAMPPGGQATAESIRDATRNALERADDLGCTSVVVPAIGTGVAGFSAEDGARIVCEVVDAFDPAALRDVRLIAYSDADYETFQRVAESIRE
ncbi:MAG: macro domain-containing protein [Haloarculaceae archaeon]